MLATSLDELLQYENADVISSFTDSYNVSEEEANDIFKETLKFLWFCQLSKSKSLFTIDTSLIVIDEMWHHFILCTRDYFDFCDRYFGRYLHHTPTKKQEKIEFEESKKSTAFEENHYSKKKEKYEEVFDIIGDENFIKWFHVYPVKYHIKNLKELRKK